MHALVTLCLLALGSAVNGERLPDDHVLWGRKGKPTSLVKKAVAATVAPAQPQQSVVADAVCKNGPLTRSCWNQEFSISSDFDVRWPNTTAVKSFSLEITNSTCNFNGQSRDCLLINGQYPGPKIEANWGDIIRVTVKNSLTTNGTGLHWHGIRQWHTPSQDGVPGITECPLAPGDTKVYQFQATQVCNPQLRLSALIGIARNELVSQPLVGPVRRRNCGHDPNRRTSHGELRRWYVGSVFAKPLTNIDLGTYPVTDWFSRMTSFQFAAAAEASLQKGQAPPAADSVLINGTTKGPLGGAYSQTTLTKGKKHRLRLINTSLESSIRVSLDNHPFLVIAADFVPVKPFTVSGLTLDDRC
jgi:hypothetical protein